MKNNVLAGLLVFGIVVSMLSISMNLGLLQGLGIPATGFITGTATTTVSASTSISLTISTVAFGAIALSEQNDTLDFRPAPLVLRNDGSADVNITVSVNDLWSSSGFTAPTLMYAWNITENESGSIPGTNAGYINLNTTNSPCCWRAFPATTTWMFNCTDYRAASDQVNIHINITAPPDEATGSKSSTVTLLAVQSDSDADC